MQTPVTESADAEGVAPLPPAAAQPSLAAKLSRVAFECAYVQKQGRNDFHRYRYATAADVLAKVNEALARHGLCATVRPEIVSEAEVKTKNGNAERLVTTRVEITIHDGTSDATLVTSGLGSGQDVGDKAVMKSQTAAIKYAWLLALNISTGDDPEQDTRVDQVMSERAERGPARGEGRAAAKSAPARTAPAEASAPTAEPGAAWVAKIDAATKQKKPAAALIHVGAELATAALNGSRDKVLGAYAGALAGYVATVADKATLDTFEKLYVERVPAEVRTGIGPRVAQAFADRARALTTPTGATGPTTPTTAETTVERDGLAAFHQSVGEIELPGEAVGLWIKFRPELAAAATADKEIAWKALCKRTEEVGGMKNANVWLKKAIALEDQRRGNPDNDQAA